MSQSEDKENAIAGHIFSVSASLVGVCMTVIGIFQLSERLQKV